MSKVEKIKTFNILMETFLGQISPMVGTSYKHYYSKIVKANAIMPIQQFYLYVSPYRTKIINKDESYFRETTNFKEKIVGDDMFQEIIRLTNIYDKLDENNKVQMWAYFQALLVLSEEYTKLSK
tara:strand:+ start:1338 stop:1709 length:372 start_codon:yes stop_codon:yes gene_type:complete